jgi:hypothetical protein
VFAVVLAASVDMMMPEGSVGVAHSELLAPTKSVAHAAAPPVSVESIDETQPYQRNISRLNAVTRAVLTSG